MKKNLLFLCLVTFCICPCGLALDVFQNAYDGKKELSIKTHDLQNGLKLVYMENRQAPVVFHGILYKIGSADNPHGKSNLAHLLEHLMFRGTKMHPGKSFRRFIASIGGIENAGTADNYTIYYQIFAKEYLNEVMAYESDRMRNLNFNENDIEAEKKIVEQEIIMRIGNNFMGKAYQAAAKVMYWRHPYGDSEWTEDLYKLTAQDLKDFYDAFYHPNNAILIISGDISFDEAKILAQKHYGDRLSYKLKDRKRMSEPNHYIQNATLDLYDFDASKSSNIFYKVKVDNVKDGMHLDSMIDYLFNNTYGKVKNHLEYEIKKVSNISCSNMIMEKNHFILYIGVSPLNMSLPDTCNMVLSNIMQAAYLPVDKKILEKIYKKNLHDYEYKIDSFSSIPKTVAELMAYDYSIDEIKSMIIPNRDFEDEKVMQDMIKKIFVDDFKSEKQNHSVIVNTHQRQRR